MESGVESWKKQKKRKSSVKKRKEFLFHSVRLEFVHSVCFATLRPKEEQQRLAMKRRDNNSSKNGRTKWALGLL